MTADSSSGNRPTWLRHYGRDHRDYYTHALAPENRDIALKGKRRLWTFPGVESA